MTFFYIIESPLTTQRPALELMREALVIANENDLPSIFRAMLNNISSGLSEPQF